MSLRLTVLILSCLLAFITSGFCGSPEDQTRFVGITNFDSFTRTTLGGATTLTSPIIKSPISWNEFVLSWNSVTPSGTWIQLEVQALQPGHKTKFYTMGIWSEDAAKHERTSLGGQNDADAKVKSDTLVLNQKAGAVQVRITMHSPPNQPTPQLKSIGLSFLDTTVKVATLPPNRAAWGKILTVPEKSQNSYPQEKGWCSPTSLSMVLGHWSERLGQPGMALDVPEVAEGIYDPNFGGTGNWPFNTAFAGKFPGVRAYVSRFTDISELEDWIVAGLPVIISAPYNLMAPNRNATGFGHLTVCIGFTETGDVVINDPATNLEKGQHVRHIYKRSDVERAWATSHHTVYLVYAEGTPLPADRFGHWYTSPSGDVRKLLSAPRKLL
ncbi:MAG: peptidase C39 family protein [Limisphaerales bacterium]